MIHARRALLALIMMLPALPGSLAAQSRPDSLSMSCEAATRLVTTRGALILGSGESYERVVRDGRFCLQGQSIQPYSVPAGDTRHCLVGYVCAQVELDPS